MDQIHRLLQTRYAEHYAIRGSSSYALYPVVNEHTLSALELSLQVKKAELKCAWVGRNPTLAELAIRARNPDQDDYTIPISVDDTDGRLRSSAKSARDRANLWIKNVVLGRFPDVEDHGQTAVRLPSPELRAKHRGNLRIIESQTSRKNI
jgi:hypothetical protein